MVICLTHGDGVVGRGGWKVVCRGGGVEFQWNKMPSRGEGLKVCTLIYSVYSISYSRVGSYVPLICLPFRSNQKWL